LRSWGGLGRFGGFGGLRRKHLKCQSWRHCSSFSIAAASLRQSLIITSVPQCPRSRNRAHTIDWNSAGAVQGEKRGATCPSCQETESKIQHLMGIPGAHLDCQGDKQWDRSPQNGVITNDIVWLVVKYKVLILKYI